MAFVLSYSQAVKRCPFLKRFEYHWPVDVYLHHELKRSSWEAHRQEIYAREEHRGWREVIVIDDEGERTEEMVVDGDSDVSMQVYLNCETHRHYL